MSTDPERRVVAACLMWGVREAVTEPANYVARGNRYAAGKRQRVARRWVLTRAAHPFSFDWCCAALELDADTLRERIERAPHEVADVLRGAGR